MSLFPVTSLLAPEHFVNTVASATSFGVSCVAPSYQYEVVGHLLFIIVTYLLNKHLLSSILHLDSAPYLQNSNAVCLSE